MCTGNGGSLADGGDFPEHCDAIANWTCEQLFPGSGLGGTAGCTSCINDAAPCGSAPPGTPGEVTWPSDYELTIANLATGAPDLVIPVEAAFAYTNSNSSAGGATALGGRGDCSLYWRSDHPHPWANNWCGKGWQNDGSGGGDYESTMQSIMLQEADWTTVTTNYPWIQAPSPAPVVENPECHLDPVIDVQLTPEVEPAEQIFLIVDVSGSMGTEDASSFSTAGLSWRTRLEAAQDAASNFVRFQQGADPGTAPEIALMAFSTTANCLPADCSLRDSSIADVRNAMTTDIEAMVPTDRTALGDALQLACDTFAPMADNGKTKAVYLLSDGHHNEGLKTPQEAFDCLDNLGGAGVKVISIHVGEDANEPLMQIISDESGGYVSHASIGAELDSIYHEAAARGQGDGLIQPRRVSVVAAPTPEFPDLEEETSTFDVTNGSTNLVLHMSALHPMWDPDIEVESPSGQFWEKTGSSVSSGMEFKDESFVILRVPVPEPGTWTLRVKHTPSEMGAHASLLTISEHNEEADCFVDVLRRIGDDGDTIVVKATATFRGPLDARSVEFTGEVQGPDLFQQLSFEANDSGAATAVVDPNGIRGSYRVDVQCRVGAGARFQPGESIHGTADFTFDLDEFTRARSVTFFMDTRNYRSCISDDCDADGIVNGDEGYPDRDTDGDGDVDYWDRDSDNDEVTDDLDPEPLDPNVPNPQGPTQACIDDPNPAECCATGQDVHEGTFFPDILFASFPPDPDCLFGYESSDTLLASHGDDFAAGGDHADIIFGGGGNDTVLGGESNDLIFASRGTNYVRGGPGNDLVVDFFSDGDWLLAEEGNDVLIAGNRNDRIYGGVGADVLVGNAGNDVIQPGPGLDAVFGGFGDDRVEILHPCEYQFGKVLLGGAGDDTLVLPTSLLAAQAVGVIIAGFEQVLENVTSNAGNSECAP